MKGEGHKVLGNDLGVFKIVSKDLVKCLYLVEGKDGYFGMIFLVGIFKIV